MKTNRIYMLTIAVMLLAVVSCGDDDGEEPIPPTPPTPTVISNSVTGFITGESVWSAVEYTDATLCEVHSEISDLELQCTPPEGYKIYLRKLPQKDNAGMYVYRIVGDMPPVAKVTYSNEYEKIVIPYTLSGNGYTDGVLGRKVYNEELVLVRYDAPEDEPKALANCWYLAEYRIVDNLMKADYEDKYTFTTTKIENYYTFDDSPIHFGYLLQTERYRDIDGNWIERRKLSLDVTCTKSLPGWIVSEKMLLIGKLVDTRFKIPDKPADYGASVYFISDNELYAMKGEYGSNGDLLRIHYYIFNIPRQE